MIPLTVLRVRVGEDEDSTESDDVLLQLLDVAVAYLQSRTGMYLGQPAELTKYVDGTGTRELWLDNLPAVAPALVISVEGPLGAWTVVPDTDYVVRDYRLLHNTRWVRGAENYKVVYTAGFADGEAPVDVQEAVISLVQHFWKGDRTAGLRSETIGEYSYTIDDRDFAERANVVLSSLGWVRV